MAPVPAAPAEAYLASRGLDPDPGDLDQMRWLPGMRGEEGALVVCVTSHSGDILAVQLTHITPDGKKSALVPARKTLAGRRDWGRQGFVRFGQTGPEITICEGTEDALSARAAGASYAVALVGFSRLGKVELPDGLDQVLVVRDADEPGSPADQALWRGIARLHGQGVKVRITERPEAVVGETATPLKDINDLWQHDHEIAEKLLQTVVEHLAKLHDASVAAVIDEASRMDRNGYERGREKIKSLIGWKRVTALDDACKARTAERRETDNESGSTVNPEPDPWPDPVTDVGGVLDEIVAEIGRYIVAPTIYFHTVALWSAHAHLLHQEDIGIEIAPRLAIQSPVKRCGKTTFLKVIKCLVPRPQPTGSLTPSSLFRAVDARKVALLVDEADNVVRKAVNPDLLAILNSGHDREFSVVIRSTPTVGGDYEDRQFQTFTSVALTSIHPFQDTFQDRCIVLRMLRALGAERPEHLTNGRSAVLFDCRRKLMRWAADLRALPEVDRPPELLNRLGDNWYGLRQVAALAGGAWPQRAFDAAVALAAADAAEEEDNTTMALLAAVWEVFARKGLIRMSTDELVNALREEDEGRWQEANGGRPITAYFLRDHLGPLIPNTPELHKARQWKVGKQNVRGYTVAHFEDPWLRYLGRDRPNTHDARGQKQTRTSGTSGTAAKSDEKSNGYSGPDAATASGTASGTDKAEQKEGVNEKVPDGPDIPNGNHPSESGVFPSGARGRRKHAANPTPPDQEPVS